LAVVERETKKARFRRARWFERRAHFVELRNPDRAKWYKARAKGLRERYDRARACGTDSRVLQVWCRNCGVVHELVPRCGSAGACWVCRRALIHRYRKRWRCGRAAALRACGWRLRGRGAWSEKFLTFTAPHAGTAEDRVRWMMEAFVLFERWFRDTYKGSSWVRVAEWEPGDDGLGHPHVHVWLLSPFLDLTAIHRAWKRALRGAGHTHWREVNCPKLQRKTSEEVEEELIKYLTKDAVRKDNGELVWSDPVQYARVLALYQGRHRTQSSRGFFERAKRWVPCANPRCNECVKEGTRCKCCGFFTAPPCADCQSTKPRRSAFALRDAVPTGPRLVDSS
jgi:hypothetical protein